MNEIICLRRAVLRGLREQYLEKIYVQISLDWVDAFMYEVFDVTYSHAAYQKVNFFSTKQKNLLRFQWIKN